MKHKKIKGFNIDQINRLYEQIQNRFRSCNIGQIVTIKRREYDKIKLCSNFAPAGSDQFDKLYLSEDKWIYIRYE